MTRSIPADGTGHAVGAVTIGAEGFLIAVTATITAGPSAFRIDGVPADGTRETRDRIRAAVINSGLPWPGQAITVAIGPSLNGCHSGLDLAIALAILSAATPACAASHDLACIAELGLDGSLRPVPGILPAVIAAAGAGHPVVMVAAGNEAEARAHPGGTVVARPSLREAVAWLRSGIPPGTPVRGQWQSASGPPGTGGLIVPSAIRLALEASAAGGHHLALTGPDTQAIAAMAGQVADLLPALGHEEILQASAAHSVAGLLGPGNPLITRPPLRAPHYTSTEAILAGSGRGATWPGEPALAHHGVLFLQDAPEFDATALALLRQPLEDGQVSAARGHLTATFPARFILVAGMRPCPCGQHPGCACTPLTIRRYQGRVSEPLGLHIPLRLDVGAILAIRPVPPSGELPGITSADRVAGARERARARLVGTDTRLNASLAPVTLHRLARMCPEAVTAVRRSADAGQLSVRGATQVMRVAWTLADLAGKDQPGAAEAGQALAFWLGTAR